MEQVKPGMPTGEGLEDDFASYEKDEEIGIYLPEEVIEDIEEAEAVAERSKGFMAAFKDKLEAARVNPMIIGSCCLAAGASLDVAAASSHTPPSIAVLGTALIGVGVTGIFEKGLFALMEKKHGK